MSIQNWIFRDGINHDKENLQILTKSWLNGVDTEEKDDKIMK